MDNYDKQPTTNIIVNDVDIDEGCVIDMDHDLEAGQEARGLTAGSTVVNGPSVVGFVKPLKEKDSGLCSRMSDDGDRTHRSLLDRQHDSHELEKRLTWIAHDERSCSFTFKDVVKAVIKIITAFMLLYIFICILDLLGNAFRLLGGKTAGSVFSDSELLQNPITGLMIGVLATVILQSSSTSSSIIITMVASKILDLRPAIFVIMGANIGTTVTNTLVSLAHSMNRREFRRAFSGAVVHDVFNWLTVIILLPLEYGTSYLYHLTKAVIDSMNIEDMKAKKQDLLKKVTKPLTSRIVMVDKKVITGIAEGKEGYANKSLLKIYCVFDKVEETIQVNQSYENGTWQMLNETVEKKIPVEKCNSLLSTLEWSDTTAGVTLFIASVLLLSTCLYCLVKLLHSLLGGQIARAARKTINADFPYPFSFLTGYAAIIVGAGMTILVQSSSVFTSALTPLVGIGCLKLERMYPLTLGSNIGTTATGILAALASSSSTIHIALQLALCHLFFNITGILLFYPVPKMRQLVIDTAKFLGRTTAKYRWFAVAYLIGMFFIFPGFFFALSFAGKIPFLIVLSLLFSLVTCICVIKCMQRSRALRKYLPERLINWKFLPLFCRSLAPYDRCLLSLMTPLSKCCCECCLKRCSCILQENRETDMDSFESDSEESTSYSASQSNLSSNVSSRMLISSPSNKENKFPESRRIYKPNSSSGATPRQSNLYVKMIASNPVLREENEKTENVSLFLCEKNVGHSCDEKAAEVNSLKVDNMEAENKSQLSTNDLNINLLVVKVDDLKESNI